LPTSRLRSSGWTWTTSTSSSSTALTTRLRLVQRRHEDSLLIRPAPQIEETMQALHDVVQAGYVRYLGMSSCWAWQFHAMQSGTELPRCGNDR
jgi:aryl-alcohol dehydrogenase-like predicted oxidoreductase